MPIHVTQSHMKEFLKCKKSIRWHKMQNYCSAWSQLEALRPSAAHRSVAAAVEILLISKYYTELHSKFCTLKIPHPKAFYFSPELSWYFAVRATSSQVPLEATFGPHASPHPAHKSAPPRLPAEMQKWLLPLVDRVLPNGLSGKLGNCARTCCKKMQKSVCLHCLEFDAIFTAQRLLPPRQHPISALSPSLKHVNFKLLIPRSLKDKP